MERVNLNKQETRYDIVYLMDEMCDSMRSIYDYDVIYNIDLELGTYRHGSWIVTDIYESTALWHDGTKIGESAYLVKTVKGVRI